eukprot:scaffold2531_cov130-Amphora_coffeaeformis.AAC.2
MVFATGIILRDDGDGTPPTIQDTLDKFPFIMPDSVKRDILKAFEKVAKSLPYYPTSKRTMGISATTNNTGSGLVAPNNHGTIGDNNHETLSGKNASKLGDIHGTVYQAENITFASAAGRTKKKAAPKVPAVATAPAPVVATSSPWNGLFGSVPNMSWVESPQAQLIRRGWHSQPKSSAETFGNFRVVYFDISRKVWYDLPAPQCDAGEKMKGMNWESIILGKKEGSSVKPSNFRPSRFWSRAATTNRSPSITCVILLSPS